MPEFSDVLRQRLASREIAAEHPDADTLTAYAEKLLPVAEREQVVEHLTMCRQCREVTSLSLAENAFTGEDLQVALLPPRKTARWPWAPWLGLAGSVAAMAVVTALIIRFPGQRHVLPRQSLEQAKSSVAAPAATSISSEPSGVLQPPAPARVAHSSEAVPGHGEQAHRVTPAVSVADRAPSAPPPAMTDAPRATASNVGVIVESIPRSDYLNKKLFDQTDASRNAATLAELPAASGLDQSGVEHKSAQLSMLADLAQPAMNLTTEKSLAPAPTSSRAGFNRFAAKVAQEAKQIVRKRSLAVQPGVMTFGAMGGAGQFNPADENAQAVESESAAAKAAADLDQSQAFTRRAMAPGAMATVDTRFQASWAVGDGKLLKTSESGAWVSGYAGGDVEFSAVTFHGDEVWAGGNHAALLHSRDGGVNWERVRLGSGASGSITSISVAAQNIQLTTSENQNWSSEDGGKSWAQQ
jgi:hypothetical protein